MANVPLISLLLLLLQCSLHGLTIRDNLTDNVGKAFWTFNNDVKGKLYSTVKLLTSRSRITKEHLSSDARKTYSLNLYIEVTRWSLNYIDLSDWDYEYPSLVELFIFGYGNVKMLTLRVFKSDVRHMDVSNKIVLKFPRSFKYQQLTSLLTRSSSIMNINLTEVSPKLERMDLQVDNHFVGLSKVNSLKSLSVIYANGINNGALKEMDQLTELHIVNVPIFLGSSVFMSDLPRLSKVIFSSMLRSTEVDKFMYRFKCSNLSQNVQEILLVHVDPFIVTNCPELFICPRCRPQSPQTLTIDSLYNFSIDTYFFPNVLPPLPVYNITHIHLTNLPVAFTTSSPKRFPLLQFISIRISAWNIIEKMMHLHQQLIFSSPLEFPTLESVTISVYTQCCRLITLAGYFQKTDNKTSILSIECLMNDTLISVTTLPSMDYNCHSNACPSLRLLPCLIAFPIGISLLFIFIF